MRLLTSSLRILCGFLFVAGLIHVAAPRAHALERLCDSSFENCRSELISRIRAEAVGIDVATWFFEDRAFTNELIARWQAGVPVRVIGDPDANVQHPLNKTLLDELAAANIPVRHKVSSGIEHWKMMLFVGQNVVYFGSANFSADAFVPSEAYRNFVDETIYLTDDDPVVDTFKTRFEDAWVNTTAWANYANAPNSSVFRKYPIVQTPDPELNFAPASGSSSYRSRSVSAYNAEQQQIDIIMYRITDQAHVDTLINAKNRGVPIRFYTEQAMYRDPSQLWHSMSVDKLYMAGVLIRDRVHAGLNHEKMVLLYGQQMTIFGSSNMTSKSSDSQHEHNYFTRKAAIFQWFESQFNRKWHNTNPLGAPETKPFVPLPPDAPSSRSPADGAVGSATSGTKIVWYGGLWAHLYDIYFGTTPEPPLIASNVALGPSLNTSQSQSFTLPTLAAGTTYYWRIVSKTMAMQTNAGPVRRFTTTSATTPPPAGDTIVLWTANVSSSRIHGDWSVGADTGAGNKSIWNPNRGHAKIAPALGSPANYFEMTFDAHGGRAYHLWMRMRAQQNSTSNDSVHVQFSGATTASGVPYARIGTSASAEVVLQDGASGATPQNWGWTDNGWGSLGPHFYFPADGTYTIRVQQREDGTIIDQIVISPDAYLTGAPGARRNDTTILAANTEPEVTPGDNVVMWAAEVSSSNIHGDWAVGSDSGAGSQSIWNPDRSRAKVAPALAAPVNYFDLTFAVRGGQAYHLWIRMRAQKNSVSNDSVHIQFSGAVTSAGQPYARIGTTQSAEPVLQDGPGGASPSSWGWTDNGWGALGPHVYFPADGTYTLRVQQREDGAIIDQIILSPADYLTTAPGARRNDTTIISP
jgi:phosphatidylserine/phosphatidylglycerophosphate/cardiolipin synthase-like enzyme